MRSTSFGKAASIAALLSIASAVANANPINVWDFNVFSRSTIGSGAQGYGSDFQGASGAVGSAWFSGFTVKGVSNTSPSLARGFYGAGDFTLSGSVDHSGIEVAGNVYMNGASIAGPTIAGGNLFGTGGSLNGPVTLGGTKNVGPVVTVNGTLTENAPYTPSLNLGQISATFLGISDYAAALPTNSSVNNQWGQLQIVASDPITVVSLSASDLNAAWGIKVSGAGTVIINLLGESVSFASKTWAYEGGAASSTTLLNLNQATTFNLSGGDHAVNILAPNASTHFSSGLVTGNLVVGSLTGSGQVNWNPGGGFTGLVPAPGTALLGLMGVGVMASRRRR